MSDNFNAEEYADAENSAAIKAMKERNERRMRAKEIAKDREDRIFLEYAKVILTKVLDVPSVHPEKFAWGNNEAAKEMRKQVLFAVINMASDLTSEHLKRNP